MNKLSNTQLAAVVMALNNKISRDGESQLLKESAGLPQIWSKPKEKQLVLVIEIKNDYFLQCLGRKMGIGLSTLKHIQLMYLCHRSILLMLI